jgi:hypothetical protein
MVKHTHTRYILACSSRSYPWKYFFALQIYTPSKLALSLLVIERDLLLFLPRRDRAFESYYSRIENT